jgi:AcrR family transcriptional regulator
VPESTEQAPRQERADAARNRRRILAAAEELFARHGAAAVRMEDIARAAGVGKGTLYRRYPDRASIAVALLDDHERALQERLLRGPPPLGPGAPPAQRLGAFYAAMVELLERHGHLALGAEEGERRFATGAYGFWRAHVHALLAAAGAPASTRDAMVEVLLAPLAPEVYRYQRHGRGRTPAEIAAALVRLAERVLGPPPATGPASGRAAGQAG